MTLVDTRVIGKKGGLVKSLTKTVASRRNGKLGGRPRKNETSNLTKAHNPLAEWAQKNMKGFRPKKKLGHLGAGHEAIREEELATMAALSPAECLKQGMDMCDELWDGA